MHSLLWGTMVGMADCKPAARLGDETVHGGKIIEGDETVLIGGKPAARVGDEHGCPVKVSGRPHEGGPVVPPGSPSVLIGGLPVARVGDQLVCKGGNDTIKTGENTVLIGATPVAAGLSARGQAVVARQTDKLTAMLQLTARDLAAGKTGKTLTPDQMKSWLMDTMMDLPLADTPLGQALGQALGLGEEDLALSPKELGSARGKEYGERIKQWGESFKEDHPGWFWSAAVLAMVGAGALTYTQGTGVLKKVGVMPKVHQDFFGKKLGVDAAMEMGPELSDPSLSLGSQQKLGDNLSLWQKGSLKGSDFSSLKLVSYSLGADYKVPLSDPDNSMKLGVSYAHDGEKKVDQVGAYLHGRQDGYNYGIDALVDPGSGGHKVSGYVGKQFSDRGSIEGYVEHSDMGGLSKTSAGVMLRFTF